MGLETLSIAEIITNLGFPIFVVLWFMFRTEKVLNSNTKAITTLTEALTKAA